MPRFLKTVLQMLLFAGIGGGIIWYMMRQMDAGQRQQMGAAIRQTRLIYAFPVIAVAYLSHWARARRWQLLMEPLGLRPSLPNTLMSVLIGYVINLVPPRAGEVAKCTILARYEGVPADKMIGTIVAERAWDVLCLLLVIGGGLAWQAGAMDDGLRSAFKAHAPSGRGIAIALAVVVGIILLLRMYYRRNRDSRIGRFIAGLGAGMGAIFRLRQRGWFLVHTLLIWGAYLGQIYLGFKSMPATDALGMGEAMLVLIFGSLAMIAAPGGVGLYPYLTGLVLHYGYGLSLPAANAFGWVSWLAQTGIILLLGLISFIYLPIYNRKPHNARQAGLDSGENI